MIICVILTFNACTTKEVIYEDRPVYVNIPVLCEIPEVKCKQNNETTSFTEIVENLAKCNQDLKEAIKICSKKDKK